MGLSDSQPVAASEDGETADPPIAVAFDESATHSARGVVESASEVRTNAIREDEAALPNSAVQVPLEALSLASKPTNEAESSTEQAPLTSDQTTQSNATDEVLDLTTGQRGAQPLDLLNSAEFNAGTDLSGSLDGARSGSQTLNWLDTYADDDNPTEPRPLVDVEAPLALPATYQVLPIEMLAQGIESLQKTSKKTPVISLAWLQAPEGVAAPIVVDTWLENASQPRLQGTVKISVDAEATLEIDLWMNSLGEDLPPNYTPMVAHPPSTAAGVSGRAQHSL